jgi:DNA-binding transcriptional LysR family regulator
MVKWLAARRLDARAVLRANSLLALRDAAASGMGLVVLPCYVGDLSAGLTRVGAPIAELGSALWLLTHPDLRRTARIRAVLDGLAELLLTLRPLFAGAARS